MTKLLLFRGSPRSNIEEVESENKKIQEECDVLCVRYVNEFEAYEYARGYFLNHPEYDYLVIATDDIIVKPEHIRQLKEDIAEFKFAVISGMMNVDEKDYPDGHLNISSCLALKDKKLRHYDWLNLSRLPADNIFLVQFAGFGLTAIRRDIIDDVGFNFASDSIFKGRGMQFGASLDFVFCWYCYEKGIPIYVDKRIFMKHLRFSGRHQVGERPKIVDINGVEHPFGYL